MTDRPLDRAAGEALPPYAKPVARALPSRIPPSVVSGSAARPPVPSANRASPQRRGRWGRRSWSGEAIRRKIAKARPALPGR